MDITAKFYALSGLTRQRAGVAGVAGGFYAEASAILQAIRTGGGGSMDCQEDIESLESKWEFRNGSEKEISEIVISILVEELRSCLSRQQEKAISQLQREMNKRRYFEPDIARLHVTSDVVLPPRVEKVDARMDVEAEVLLVTYQNDQDQVTEVRRKIFETSALLSVLSSKAIEQQEVATTVLETATESVGHVDRAEEQLRKAIRNNDGYKFYILMYLWILTGLVWTLDFIT